MSLDFKKPPKTSAVKGCAQLLQLLEPKFKLKDRIQSDWSPIFIIGAPRSGTTLLYQSMIEHFTLVYLSNWALRFEGAEVSASRIVRGRLRKFRASYKSNYGKSLGLFAPSEGESFWHQWFTNKDTPEVSDNYDPVKYGLMREKVLTLQNDFSCPFINKSTNNLQRLPVLEQAFPNARYIIIQRKSFDIVYSMMLARRRREASGISLTRWYATKPKDWERWKDESPLIQVCAQIAGVKNDLRQFIADMGVERCIEFDYDIYCKQPGTVLARVADFYSNSGQRLKPRYSLPESFPVISHCDKDDFEANAIREVWDRFFPDDSL